MRANRSVSGAELKFRRALWAEGVRGYRLRQRLPGRPDLVFPALRLAVFVHGCYWHRCPACALPQPRANSDFWRAKFEDNLSRDRKAADALTAAGWTVRVVWEHDLRADLLGAAKALADHVLALRQAL